MEELAETDYAALVTEIKHRIRTAQYEALRAVNKELIDLYWNIGKLIVERQQGASWGFAVVEQLAADIRQEFPGIQGFSARNIWYMRLSTLFTVIVKNCNHWLQKLDGAIISPFSRSAKTIWSANSISA